MIIGCVALSSKHYYENQLSHYYLIKHTKKYMLNLEDGEFFFVYVTTNFACCEQPSSRLNRFNKTKVEAPTKENLSYLVIDQFSRVGTLALEVFLSERKPLVAGNTNLTIMIQ